MVAGLLPSLRRKAGSLRSSLRGGNTCGGIGGGWHSWRWACPPAEVFLTAELVDGVDQQDLHCPEIEWDFADGSRSVHQEDCEPFTAGTKLERRFTRRHAFDAPGEYQVIVTLRRSNRVLAQAATTIIVHGGATTGGSPYQAALH